jgi:hypothetical protein
MRKLVEVHRIKQELGSFDQLGNKVSETVVAEANMSYCKYQSLPMDTILRVPPTSQPQNPLLEKQHMLYPTKLQFACLFVF